MNPQTLAIEAARLRVQLADARALLALCLTYVEDCAQDPAYKGDRVADLARRIREEVAR